MRPVDVPVPREAVMKRVTGELSPRQREVLKLLAKGHTMKETARVLKITPRTVAYHKYRIMEELGIRSSAELVHFAIKQGVVSV
jgi:DNA-binding CsgD family transcriptional regulator